MLRIGGLAPFTTIDYPGCLSAVVFCQGCGWRCGYCHNKHLQPFTNNAKCNWSSIVSFLKSRVEVLDAVVFSGGEPTAQKDLYAAIIEVRRLGFKIGLHTSGSNPNVFEKCLSVIDWVGFDIKAPFDEYAFITCIKDSGEKAEESAGILRASNVSRQFRTTIDPFLLEEDRLIKMQELVKSWGEELVLQEMRL